MDITVFFLPTIENHFSNFLPLINVLSINDITSKILLVEEAIPNGRQIIVKKNNDDILFCRKNEISIILSKNKAFKIFLVVGNDSEPKTCEIIRLFRKYNSKIILFQDGWLDSKNINNPIYPTKRFFTPLKKQVHKLLTQKWSPVRNYFHNFIGQNSDYFFVYSEVAKLNFIKADIKKEQIFIVGSPRHHILKNTNSLSEKKAKVIFLTVTNSEKELKTVKECIEWITNFYSNELVILKLHPNEDINNYEELIGPNLILLKVDLIDLITQFNIEMSFCFASTVIFDMLIMNIPIIQLLPIDFSKKHTNYFYDLPSVSNEVDLNYVIKNYEINKVKKNASKYLKDIAPSFNSVDATINTIKILIQ